MTPEDRELLQAVRRHQADLRQALSRIDLQLAGLEERHQFAELPPLPLHDELPAIPQEEVPTRLSTDEAVSLPELPPLPEPARNWTRLFRVANLIVLLTLMLFAIWLNARFNVLPRLGPWGNFPCSAYSAPWSSGSAGESSD